MYVISNYIIFTAFPFPCEFRTKKVLLVLLLVTASILFAISNQQSVLLYVLIDFSPSKCCTKTLQDCRKFKIESSYKQLRFAVFLNMTKKKKIITFGSKK